VTSEIGRRSALRLIGAAPFAVGFGVGALEAQAAAEQAALGIDLVRSQLGSLDDWRREHAAGPAQRLHEPNHYGLVRLGASGRIRNGHCSYRNEH